MVWIIRVTNYLPICWHGIGIGNGNGKEMRMESYSYPSLQASDNTATIQIILSRTPNVVLATAARLQ